MKLKIEDAVYDVDSLDLGIGSMRALIKSSGGAMSVPKMQKALKAAEPKRDAVKADLIAGGMSEAEADEEASLELFGDLDFLNAMTAFAFLVRHSNGDTTADFETALDGVEFVPEPGDDEAAEPPDPTSAESSASPDESANQSSSKTSSPMSPNDSPSSATYSAA